MCELLSEIEFPKKTELIYEFAKFCERRLIEEYNTLRTENDLLKVEIDGIKLQLKNLKENFAVSSSVPSSRLESLPSGD